jgi:inhibitor of cysteine peptidase
MKSKVLIIIVLVLMIVSLGTYLLIPRRPVTIGASDAGKTITISKGDFLNISLAGNPTTGYTWEALPQNPSLLKQIGEPLVKPATSAIGSGGMITLKFQAIQTGQTQLKLVYHRAWEKDVAPLETFETTVVVK